jgi:hypothetical protein
MSEPLTSRLKYWPYLLAAVLQIGLLVLFAWDRERDTKLADALAHVARLQERVSRADRLEECRAWDRLDEAAAHLDDEDPKSRAEALVRFRQELHRLKVRYAYPQLGTDSKECRP